MHWFRRNDIGTLNQILHMSMGDRNPYDKCRGLYLSSVYNNRILIRNGLTHLKERQIQYISINDREGEWNLSKSRTTKRRKLWTLNNGSSLKWDCSLPIQLHCHHHPPPPTWTFKSKQYQRWIGSILLQTKITSNN